MLIFCDESWKANASGKKVGTLAALAIPRDVHNDIEDRVFVLSQKYFGFENARSHEIKGKELLSHYEYRREHEKRGVSIKLAFARELLEELKIRHLKVFASVIYAEKEVELLCEDAEQFDRAYWFLMERINGYLQELGGDPVGSMVFDDRGLTLNERVATGYRNFLSRSKLGRSFSRLLRVPLFAYSRASTGLQLADLVCTVINRFHTDRAASHHVPAMYSIVRDMEWKAKAPNADGYSLSGIKILGG